MGSGAPVPPGATVWWMALNQTCPNHAGSWLFVEQQAATAPDGSFLGVVSQVWRRVLGRAG